MRGKGEREAFFFETWAITTFSCFNIPFAHISRITLIHIARFHAELGEGQQVVTSARGCA